MEGWLWCVVGVLLLGAELIIPGGFFLFVVGLGALGLGLLLLIGAPLNETAQYLVFAVLSLVFLLTLRKKMSSSLFSSTPDISDDLAGKELSVTEAISPGAEGSVEFRGTVWRAMNRGPTPLSPGDRAKIDRVDGLKLLLSKI